MACPWAYRYIGWGNRCILCSISNACSSCYPTDRGTEREPEGARREGTACWDALLYLLLSRLCPRRAIGGHQELGPQSVWVCPSFSRLDDSTSPGSRLGSEGPRQVGEEEPLLLSQQLLLLPLPVLLKFWLWTQGGGGSCQPLPPPKGQPHPPGPLS